MAERIYQCLNNCTPGEDRFGRKLAVFVPDFVTLIIRVLGVFLRSRILFNFVWVLFLSLGLATESLAGKGTKPTPTTSQTTEFDFAKYVRLRDQGNLEKAYIDLLSQSDEKKSKDALYLKYFALGEWAFNLKKWSDARAHLDQARLYGNSNLGQIYYMIGHSYKEQPVTIGNTQKAIEAFTSALHANPPQNIVFQAHFELSELALEAGNYSRAITDLKFLERKSRGMPNYAEVLWRLLGADLKLNRRYLACQWARKIFSRYPSFEKVADWGVELSENKFEGKKILCVASSKDVKLRIKNLVLSGLANKANSEIEVLRSHARPSEIESIDILQATHLERQGFPDEALKLLVKYYSEQKRNLNYLNLLGKVASRAGEFQMAIGAYYDAYKLSPRSRHGRSALFSAAFLSYQIQDYDGATRKFKDVTSKFAGSGLARDAKWNLAWLEYLKSDFAGAEKSFRSLINERYVLRRRRVIHPFRNDRTKYWLAMSLFRQKKYASAKTLLAQLASDRSFGYYSLLAKNRLVQIPAAAGKLSERNLSSASSSDSSSANLFSPNGEKELVAEASDAESQSGDEDSEDSVSEDASDDADSTDASKKSVAKLEAVNGDAADDSTDDEASADSADNGDESEIINVTDLRDPRLLERFNRVNNLIAIGQRDWAKWELYEIERRTRNRTYLKMLMAAYAKIGSFNRMSYISEIYFGSERSRGGFSGSRDLWEFSYPKAFGDTISESSNKFSVPQELILAIMRAESHFNMNAYSPVGARGLMQIMPYTANQVARLMGEPEVSEPSLLIPEVNIRLGTRYLSRLEKKFQGAIPLVAAGYNAGPHRVYSWLNAFGSVDMDEFIEHIPYVETRNYVKKVVRNFAIYSELYSHKPATCVWLTQPITIHVSQRPSPRENWEIID